MKIPLSPPSLQEFFAKHKTKDQFMQIIDSVIGPCDDKGRYLHWDKLRHLEPPVGFDSETYWFAMRLARTKISKNLAFKDKKNECFTYGIPDFIMRGIMWIVEHATGAIATNVKITDARTKKTYIINSLIEREAENVLENSSLQGELNGRQLSILKNALNNPGVEYTIRSHQASHGISYQTARTDLLKLSDEYHIIKKYKRGRTDIFIAPQDLKERIKNT